MGWWRLTLIALVTLALFSPAPIAHRPTRSANATANRTMGYGMLGGDFSGVQATGFNWTKILASWRDLEPSRGSYSSSAFSSLSSTVNDARSHGLSVMLNVSHSPTWATGSGSDTAAPTSDNDLADFMAYLAAYFSGRIGAYEIWNEPNLAIEWGNQRPSPVKYSAMLRALFPRVKTADPNALVVTGGLSTTGDGISDTSYGDLAWIRDIYQLGNIQSCSDGAGGLRSCFDAIGSHPYGGPFAPDIGPNDPQNPQYTVGMYFRRAEQHRQMMEVFGSDYNRGVWVTEFNWLIDPGAFGIGCSWGSGWDSYKLSGNSSQQEATQADYLVRAFNYAYTNWSWMMGMIIFNYDFLGSSQCDQVRWYSLTRDNYTRRPAFTSLTNMAKPGISGPSLHLSSAAAQFLLPTDTTPMTATQTIQITNAGSGALTWTATKTQQTWLGLGSPITGTAPSDLTINVDKTGLATGTYTGTVTLTAGGGALSSPQQIQVRLYVWHAVELPAVGKN